jgi:hypothetical protein
MEELYFLLGYSLFPLLLLLFPLPQHLQQAEVAGQLLLATAGWPSAQKWQRQKRMSQLLTTFFTCS